ncbi:MAG: response regulator transcription factor [Verrucomicrobiota bacterium]|nr:response regulator transcription factor [Verrucomicrobiota bacterium]
MRRNKKTARWRIIIVDDQPLFRRGLAELIHTNHDFMVSSEVGSRPEALEALANDLPDLITMELSLDGTDGMELLKDIHVRFPTVPTLVISTHDESIYAERAFRAGAKGYVTKRESDKTVLTAIRLLLEGRKYISPKMTSWFAEQYLEGRAANEGSPVAALSDRELEVFRLLGEHKTRREISRRLNLSVKTVESYRAKIKEKLGLSSGSELIERASRWVADRK